MNPFICGCYSLGPCECPLGPGWVNLCFLSAVFGKTQVISLYKHKGNHCPLGPPVPAKNLWVFSSHLPPCHFLPTINCQVPVHSSASGMSSKSIPPSTILAQALIAYPVAYCNSLQAVLLISRLSCSKPFSIFWSPQNTNQIMELPWLKMMPRCFEYHWKPTHIPSHIFPVTSCGNSSPSQSFSSPFPASQATLPHTPAPPCLSTSSFKAFKGSDTNFFWKPSSTFPL